MSPTTRSTLVVHDRVVSRFYFDPFNSDDEALYRAQRALLIGMTDIEVELSVASVVFLARAVVAGREVDNANIEALDAALTAVVRAAFAGDVVVVGVSADARAKILTQHPYALQLGRLALIRSTPRR